MKNTQAMEAVQISWNNSLFIEYDCMAFKQVVNDDRYLWHWICVTTLMIIFIRSIILSKTRIGLRIFSYRISSPPLTKLLFQSFVLSRMIRMMLVWSCCRSSGRRSLFSVCRSCPRILSNGWIHSPTVSRRKPIWVLWGLWLQYWGTFQLPRQVWGLVFGTLHKWVMSFE